MSHHYEIYIDHYSGPTRVTCLTKKEIPSLVKKVRGRICGGCGPTRVYKITTKDVTKEVL